MGVTRCGGWAPLLLRDPVDQGQGLAGRGHAVAGGALGGRAVVHLAAAPVLLEERGHTDRGGTSSLAYLRFILRVGTIHLIHLGDI